MPIDPRARLYFVCGATPGGRPLGDVLGRALAGGVDIFQLRMKDAPDDAVLAVAAVARAACTEAGVPFILNDRPDLVEAAGADGVHVGQDDEPVAAARAVAGADAIVGVSTHTPQQVDAALATSADYFAAGPVHATPTKPGRPAAGLALIRHAAARADRPFFAIGGLDAANVDLVLEAGARKIVVVRAIAEAPDPERAARMLRQRLDAVAEVVHGPA